MSVHEYAICDWRCSGKSNLNKHVVSVHEGKNCSNVLFVTRAVLIIQQMLQHVAKKHEGKFQTTYY